MYKVTLDYVNDTVNDIKIKYFDTVSVAAGLCILKSGFLFVASEFGNHSFYQFEKLGDDDDTPEYSSSDFMTNDGEPLDTKVYFKPRPLENLLLVDELTSMAPLTDAKVRCHYVLHIHQPSPARPFNIFGYYDLFRYSTSRTRIRLKFTHFVDVDHAQH